MLRKPRNLIGSAKSIQKIINRLDISKIRSGHKWLEKIASLTTILAMGFLIYSIYQTDSLVTLQQRTSSSIDTTLTVLKQQLLVMQETNGFLNRYLIISDSLLFLTRGDGQKNLKAYVEENRPRMVITKVDCKLSKDTTTIYFNLKNAGQMAASDIKIQLNAITLDKLNKFESTVSENAPIISNFNQILIMPIVSPVKRDFVSRIKVSWKWPAYNLIDSLISYRIAKYDSVGGPPRIFLMSDTEGEAYFNSR